MSENTPFVAHLLKNESVYRLLQPKNLMFQNCLKDPKVRRGWSPASGQLRQFAEPKLKWRGLPASAGAVRITEGG
jgi:hypothetical protein